MATTAPDRRGRYVEALGFWFITLVICGVAGLASYRFGRQWIGDRLGGEVKSVLTSDDLASRVTEEAFADRGSVGAEEVRDEPPEKAVVEVEPTALSTEDRQKLRLEKERGARGSGAEDRSSDEDDREERAAGSDDGEPEAERSREEAGRGAETEEAPQASSTIERGSRDHTVRAGSFAKADNAESLVEELRRKGYQPFVTEAVVGGVKYHRVNVARYDDRDKALDLRRELRAEGYAAEISTE